MGQTHQAETWIFLGPPRLIKSAKSIHVGGSRRGNNVESRLHAYSPACLRFLKRVSVMGRKNVHSRLYCLQCAQMGCSSPLTSAVGRMSHRIFLDRYTVTSATGSDQIVWGKVDC